MTPPPSAHQALLSRIEGATTGSAALDAEIMTLLFGEPQAVGNDDEPRVLHWWDHGFGRATPLRFTRALDAAMTLVPTVTPHTDRTQWHLDASSDGINHASVYCDGVYYHSPQRSPTPALALCLAAIRARFAQEKP